MGGFWYWWKERNIRVVCIGVVIEGIRVRVAWASCAGTDGCRLERIDISRVDQPIEQVGDTKKGLTGGRMEILGAGELVDEALARGPDSGGWNEIEDVADTVRGRLYMGSLGVINLAD
jgi:hypothetical protein